MTAEIRRLSNWIDGFIEYTEGFSSPLLFRRWAAICAIAGALERKVWITTDIGPLYPTMYIVLVAGAGVGKSLPLNVTERLWRGLTTHHVAPTSVTKASLVDALNDAKRQLVLPQYVDFNTLLVPSTELGVLLPSYENDFMNTLTSIYDGGTYSEHRRTSKLKLAIERPQIILFGATTPDYLRNFLPVGAWDQGFISRTLLIYSGERNVRRIFGNAKASEDRFTTLQHDLKIIGNYYNEVRFTPAAQDAIEHWNWHGQEPVPDHPKLASYVARRLEKLIKLCMIASINTRSDFIIDLPEYQMAMDWLIEAETAMPDIFRAMTSGADSNVMDEAWHWVYKTFLKESNRPISETRLVYFLREKVPAHNVMRVIEVMERAGLLKPKIVSGLKCFEPGAKG